MQPKKQNQLFIKDAFEACLKEQIDSIPLKLYQGLRLPLKFIIWDIIKNKIETEIVNEA